MSFWCSKCPGALRSSNLRKWPILALMVKLMELGGHILSKKSILAILISGIKIIFNESVNLKITVENEDLVLS